MIRNVTALTPEEIEDIKGLTGSPSLKVGTYVKIANRNKGYSWLTQEYLVSAGLSKDSFPEGSLFGFCLRDLDFLKTGDSFLIFSIDIPEKRLKFTELSKAVRHFLKQL